MPGEGAATGEFKIRVDFYSRHRMSCALHRGYLQVYKSGAMVSQDQPGNFDFYVKSSTI